MFSPLPLPPGNEIRRADGAPGRDYWQQRVGYLIRASLDTAAKRIDGTETIRYTNNSPDSLRFIWMQLDQNLFRPGSTGSLLNASESRFGSAEFQGGFDITSVTQCSIGPARPKARRRAAAKRASSDTAAGGTDCSRATQVSPLRARVD